MSFPTSNTSGLTLKQKDLVLKLRSDHGIHIIETNPHTLQDKKNVKIFFKLPLGVQDNTTQTIVIQYPTRSTSDTFKYRIRSGETFGNTKGSYGEFYLNDRNLNFYQTVNGNDKTHVLVISLPTRDPVFMVLQMHVENRVVKASADGGPKVTAKDKDYTNYEDCKIHRVDFSNDSGRSLTFMEAHVTYDSDPATVFDQTDDFTMPHHNLNPGACVVWEGSASSPFTLKNGSNVIYNGTKTGNDLRLVMQVFTMKILVGLEDQQMTPVAYTDIQDIVLSKEFKLTNFIMETGAGRTS